MCEVVLENFEEKWKEIEKNVKSAAFISLDSEFSGLKTSNSLFDGPSQRYENLKEYISPYIILQIGITTFQFDRDNNRYNGHTYSIYLCPRTFSSNDQEFQFRASTFEFLCEHNFDFNKVAYHGIPFLNEVQDQQTLQDLEDKQLFRLVQRSLSHSDERAIQSMCSQVALWLAGGKQNVDASEKTLMLPIPPNSQFRKYIAYIVHHELRSRFMGVWSIPEEEYIRVYRITQSERAMLEKNETHESELQAGVLSAIRGFNCVFQLLVKAGKPIIGHNLMLDLMMMYKQFYRPLPKSYAEFKTSIHTLFPRVYDTKYMSLELRNKLPKQSWWESNGLDGLYAYFRGEKGRTLAPFSPMIFSFHYADERNSEKFHDAGWDSYCTGFCFIYMAHYFATATRGRISLAKPLTSTEHIALTSNLCNKVNMIRGNVTHFVLDGDDPPSRRPELLVVEMKNKKRIDQVQLTVNLAQFGNVDVKMLSPYQAIVAAAVPSVAKEILQAYYLNPEIVVRKFSHVQHNKVLRYSIIGSTAAIGLIFVYLTYRGLSVDK